MIEDATLDNLIDTMQHYAEVRKKHQERRVSKRELDNARNEFKDVLETTIKAEIKKFNIFSFFGK